MCMSMKRYLCVCHYYIVKDTNMLHLCLLINLIKTLLKKERKLTYVSLDMILKSVSTLKSVSMQKSLSTESKTTCLKSVSTQKSVSTTLADRLAEKKGTKISIVTNWIRTKISFALLRSSLLCIRGSRAVYQKPDVNTEDITLSENNSRL